MIYIETHSTDVYYNFAVEYYMTVEKQLDDTVFLFWRTTPTLMIGKYQNVLEEINKPYTDAHDIRIVRRFSGGGTIYTDLGGWQYTFIQRQATEEIAFHEYIAPVVDALQEMGVPATFNGRNDLTIHDKKFSGTAQYRLNDRLVHHGSLLFATDIEQMVAATTVDPHKILSKSIKSVRDRVTNISDHLPAPIDAATFKERMIHHITEGQAAYYTLTVEDDARIRQLAEEKFANWEAIYGANPKFSIERTGYLPGGKMQFSIDVNNGIIQNATVNGDFFATIDAETLCSAIIGARYEQNAVREALAAGGVDGAIYRISIDEIAVLIVD